MSTKVNNPVTIDTTDGKKLCVKGKLVLIRNVVSATVHVKPDGKGYVPVIISETEQEKSLIENESWIMFTSSDGERELALYTGTSYGLCFRKLTGETGVYQISRCCVVLVLPEQFTTEQLNNIVEGKYKDGDSVWVEVRPDREEGTTHYAMGSFNWEVAVNEVNKVSLFDVVPKMYTNKELVDACYAFKSFNDEIRRNGRVKSSSDWFNENYPQ